MKEVVIQSTTNTSNSALLVCTVKLNSRTPRAELGSTVHIKMIKSRKCKITGG